MRGIIPPDIFTGSSEAIEQLGLSSGLVKRLNSKKCLWLIRMDVNQINKLHEAELLGKYNYAAQNLDIVETAAIYASLPATFTLDSTGRKTTWRQGLVVALRQMITMKDNGTLRSVMMRNPVYKDADAALFLERETLFSHEQAVLSTEDDSEVFLRERMESDRGKGALSPFSSSSSDRKGPISPVESPHAGRTESAEWMEVRSPFAPSAIAMMRPPRTAGIGQHDDGTSKASDALATGTAVDVVESERPEQKESPHERRRESSVDFAAMHAKLGGLIQPKSSPAPGRKK
jgi:hypothetical protein